LGANPDPSFVNWSAEMVKKETGERESKTYLSE